METKAELRKSVKLTVDMLEELRRENKTMFIELTMLRKREKMCDVVESSAIKEMTHALRSISYAMSCVIAGRKR